MAKPHDALRTFGLQLRGARERAGLTGQDLAVRAGWSHSKVSKLERGQQTPTAADVQTWATATEAPPQTVLELHEGLDLARLDYAGGGSASPPAPGPGSRPALTPRPTRPCSARSSRRRCPACAGHRHGGHPLFRGLLGAPPEGELEVPALNPAGRVADPAEVAAFVAFLLSDEAAFITGAALAVDGGFTAQ